MDETVQSFTTEYANRIVIDNMEQLKFLKVPEQNRKEVHMLGYYEPKDGGGRYLLVGQGVHRKRKWRDYNQSGRYRGREVEKNGR